MPQNLRKAFGHTRGFVRAAFGSHILNDQISARRILRQNHTKEIVKKQQQSDFVSGSDGKPWLAVAFEWSAQQQAEYKLTLPTFALMQWRPTKCRHATMFHLQIKHDQLCDSMNGMHMSAAQFICMHACAGRFGPDPTWPPHPHSLEIADPHQGAHQTPSTHLHTPTTKVQVLLYLPMQQWGSASCSIILMGLRDVSQSLVQINLLPGAGPC